MGNNLPQKLIVQSNSLVEAEYRLSILELRLIHMCLAQIKKGLNTANFVIRVGDIIDLEGVSGGASYQNLKDAALRLMDRRVRISNEPNGTPFQQDIVQVTSWVHTVQYSSKRGEIQLSLSPTIIPYLSQLSREFTQYRMGNVSKLKSVHAIRIYELLVQWRDLGERKIGFDWLRVRLGLQGSYRVAGDLRKIVIDPALNQINLHTDIKIIDRDYKKTGRKLTSVTIKFKSKTGKHSHKTPPNLEMFPVGRAVNPVEAEIDRDPSKKLRELEASKVKTTVDSETTAV